MKRTKAKLKVRNIAFPNMDECISKFIQECPFCQKSNFRSAKIVSRPYTLAGQAVMQHLMMDHVGPFPADDEGMQYILVITDTFSRWTMLFPTKSTSAEEACHALIQHMGIFGAPSVLSSDGGAAFTAGVTAELTRLVGTDHKIDTAYSSERHAIVENRNAQVNKHLRALVFEQNSLAKWSIILPFVQRILNAEVMASTQLAPARIIFGEAINLDRGILFPNTTIETCVVDGDKLSKHTQELIKAQRIAIKVAQEVQSKTDSDHINKKMKLATGPLTVFKPGDHVLCEYPDTGLGKRPPHKALTPHKGPFQVIKPTADGNEYEIRDLVSGKSRFEPVNRLRMFQYDKERVNPLDVAIRDGVKSDSGVFVVESILRHQGTGHFRAGLKFLVKWLGYPEPTWEPWSNLRTNEVAHAYMREFPDLEPAIAKRFKT